MGNSKTNSKRVLTSRELYLQQWEADYTPRDVVVQGLSRAIEGFPSTPLWYRVGDAEADSKPVQFLDPSAGSGVFSSVFFDIMWARLKGEVPIACTNIEPRREEELPLLQLGHPHWGCTFETWLAMWAVRDARKAPKYDCIATNPPFTKLAPKDGDSWIPKLLDLLQPYGCLILYAKDELGQRSKAGTKLFKDYPPFAQYRVAGPVSHREDNKADSRCYSFWVWAGRGAPKVDYWITENLPLLPTASRQLQANKPSERIDQ